MNILLVEDNANDAHLAKEALREIGASGVTLHHVFDGEQALAFVYNNDPAPDLILLDLNIPRKRGMEVLEELKAHDFYRRIPIFILTMSTAERDIDDGFYNHANLYLPKRDYLRTVDMMRVMLEFFEFCKFPE